MLHGIFRDFYFHRAKGRARGGTRHERIIRGRGNLAIEFMRQQNSFDTSIIRQKIINLLVLFRPH
jgi:hypothetical protein